MWTLRHFLSFSWMKNVPQSFHEGSGRCQRFCIVLHPWSSLVQHATLSCINKPLSQSQLRRPGLLHPSSLCLSQSLVSAGWLCFGFGKWTMDHFCWPKSADCFRAGKVTPGAHRVKINPRHLKKYRKVYQLEHRGNLTSVPNWKIINFS